MEKNKLVIGNHKNYMNLKRSKYTGVDFEFKPYSFETVKKEDDSWER